MCTPMGGEEDQYQQNTFWEVRGGEGKGQKWCIMTRMSLS